MRFRSFVVASAATFASLVPMVCLSQTAQANMTLTRKTEVPGATLNPGNYSIQVVDHLSDRMIVRVDNSVGQKQAVFLGVNAPNLPKTGSVEWQTTGNGDAALRGYTFANGPSVEFVYPKADAVRLAKSNTSSVVAIDPASEGKKPKNMSGDDLQMVSLWLLTPTRVGPESQAAIGAKHFEATPEKSPVVASTSPAGSATGNAGTQLAKAETRPDLVDPQPAPKPAAPRRHVVKVLPHTASSMPLVWVVAASSLCGALMLRRRRLA